MTRLGINISLIFNTITIVVVIQEQTFLLFFYLTRGIMSNFYRRMNKC
jgi:hypothetical protein